MRKPVLLIEESHDSGYTSRAVGEPIFTAEFLSAD